MADEELLGSRFVPLWGDGNQAFVLRTRDGAPQVVECRVVPADRGVVAVQDELRFHGFTSLGLDGDLRSADKIIIVAESRDHLLRRGKTDCFALLSDAGLHVKHIDDIVRIERLTLFLSALVERTRPSLAYPSSYMWGEGENVAVLRWREDEPRLVECKVALLTNGFAPVQLRRHGFFAMGLTGDVRETDDVVVVAGSREQVRERVKADCFGLLCDAERWAHAVDDSVRIERLSMFLRDWM